MTATTRVIWRGNLRQNLAELDPKIRHRLAAMMTYTAPRMEAWARSNAPWHDRTGNARRGLTAVALHSENQYQIIMFHRVPYGIWLEVRWSGRLQIIMPTIRHGVKDLEALTRGLLA